MFLSSPFHPSHLTLARMLLQHKKTYIPLIVNILITGIKRSTSFYRLGVLLQSVYKRWQKKISVFLGRENSNVCNYFRWKWFGLLAWRCSGRYRKCSIRQRKAEDFLNQPGQQPRLKTLINNKTQKKQTERVQEKTDYKSAFWKHTCGSTGFHIENKTRQLLR